VEPAQDVAISADGARIAFESAGEGPPLVVFVHGWSCDRTFWAAQMAAFAHGQRVAALDLGGHGESGTDRASWTMAAFGADVAAVVDRLGADDVVLVGHSMGGDVVVEASRRLGQRVRGLVWVDTYDSLDDPMTPDELDAFVAPFRTDFRAATDRFVRSLFLPNTDPAIVERVARVMSSAPPTIALNSLRHSFGNQAAAAAGVLELRAPVVSIHPASSPPDRASFRRHGVTPVAMDGIGHFPMLEAPDQFNRLLADVIAGFPIKPPTDA
jgi:pimeloyl-ACP methyl ester carboxylesterase